MLRGVPLNPLLPASHLRQRCWQAPAGLFKKTEELRLGCGGLPDLRRVVLLVLPHPAPGRLLSPWGGVVLKRGEEHRDGLLFLSKPRTQPPLSASPSDATPRWSPARISHHRLPKTKQKEHKTCLSLVVEVVCGGGSDVWHNERLSPCPPVAHLIMGAVPCGHGPRPCTCVQGPEKSPPQLSAARNEFLSRCNCGNTTVFSTTAPVELAPPANRTSTTLSRNNCGMMTTCGTRTTSVTGASITLTSNWEISMVRRSLDHGNRPLHHDRE